MPYTDNDRAMKALEIFGDFRVADDEWFTIRLDGRNFSKLTEKHFDKPFDRNFAEIMGSVTAGLMFDSGALLGYTQSDEISLVFDPANQFFGRRVEKLISVLAGEASSLFSDIAEEMATFDARLVMTSVPTLVRKYVWWRNGDAVRNAARSQYYWALRQHDGFSARAATTEMHGMSEKDLLFALHRHPACDIRPRWTEGRLLTWESTPHIGHNPLTGEDVETTRRKIKITYEESGLDIVREVMRVVGAE